jgi:hypothetical protein
MTTRRSLGIFFIVVGAVGLSIGLYTALSAMGGMYKDALDDPLGDPKGGESKQVSREMLTAVVTGVVGAIPFTLGLRMVLPRGGRRGMTGGRARRDRL